MGTPFQHQGRLKGIACDCVGLPYMVAEELGLRSRDKKMIHKHENSNYESQPTRPLVHSECQRLLVEKPISEMKEGDVLTIKMPLLPCHVGIVSKLYEGTANECWGIIHGYAPVKKVVETVLDDQMLRRVHGAFSFSGVTD